MLYYKLSTYKKKTIRNEQGFLKKRDMWKTKSKMTDINVTIPI